jgi:hypothetical protein
MLERARVANPDIELYRHDFRVGRPEWRNSWGLVSSMWHAYGYVEIDSALELDLSGLRFG